MPQIELNPLNCSSNTQGVTQTKCNVGGKAQITGIFAIPVVYSAHPTTLCFESQRGSEGAIFSMIHSSMTSAGIIKIFSYE